MYSRQRATMAMYDSHFNGYRLFIGDIDADTSRYDIEEMFGAYGPMMDVWLARNPPGFAFVVFKNIEDCERAARRCHGRRLHHRRIRVEFARPYSERKPTSNEAESTAQQPIGAQGEDCDLENSEQPMEIKPLITTNRPMLNYRPPTLPSYHYTTRDFVYRYSDDDDYYRERRESRRYRSYRSPRRRSRSRHSRSHRRRSRRYRSRSRSRGHGRSYRRHYKRSRRSRRSRTRSRSSTRSPSQSSYTSESDHSFRTQSSCDCKSCTPEVSNENDEKNEPQKDKGNTTPTPTPSNKPCCPIHGDCAA